MHRNTPAASGRIRTLRRCLCCLALAGAWLCPVDMAEAGPRKRAEAVLLHFTSDLTAAGEPLTPGVAHHSMWSGLGRGSDGTLYFTASNHRQPGGNVAIYALNPKTDRLTALGDLEQVSGEADNWMPGESQHKVHSFLHEHADGSLYFASLDYEPSPLLRGSHLYRIVTAAEGKRVEDVSRTWPIMMSRELKTIENPGRNEENSGVAVAWYGIKNLGLHPSRPDLMYAMTHPEGHLIRIDLDAQMRPTAMAVVGRSPLINYVFYVDQTGAVYFGAGDEKRQSLLKYNPADGRTTTLAADLPPGDFGALAPAADGQTVYILHAQTRRLYRLDLRTQTFTPITELHGGEHWWRLYNLSLSPDGKNLYYVCVSTDRKSIQRLHLGTKRSFEVLDITALLGTRDLCFGGVNMWDDRGAFYVPVWTHDKDQQPIDDLAILRAAVEKPLAE